MSGSIGIDYWNKYFKHRIGETIQDLSINPKKTKVYEGWNVIPTNNTPQANVNLDESVTLVLDKKLVVPQTGPIFLPVLIAGKKCTVNLNGIRKPIMDLMKFRPDQIRPAVTNLWLSPTEIRKNFETFLETNTSVIPLTTGPLVIASHDNIVSYFKGITDALFSSASLAVPRGTKGCASVIDTKPFVKAALTKKNDVIPDKVLAKSWDKLISPMMFELFQAMRLALLIERGDKEALRTVGLKAKTPAWIFIPTASNFALVDFFVAASSKRPSDMPDQQTGNGKSTPGILRISVKSKLAGTSTNTMKFADAFNNRSDIDAWVKTKRPNNAINEKVDIKGPAAVAYAHDSANHAIMSSTLAVVYLWKSLKTEVTSAITALGLPTKLGSTTLDDLFRVVDKIPTNTSLSVTTADAFGASGNAARPLMDAMIWAQASKAVSGIKNTPGLYIVGNMNTVFDKILENMSHRDHHLNFYQMFYDQIILKRAVCYAVIYKSEDVAKPFEFEFKYYTAQNFDKYFDASMKKWISLRSKNYIIPDKSKTSSLAGIGIAF